MCKYCILAKKNYDARIDAAYDQFEFEKKLAAAQLNASLKKFRHELSAEEMWNANPANKTEAKKHGTQETSCKLEAKA